MSYYGSEYDQGATEEDRQRQAQQQQMEHWAQVGYATSNGPWSQYGYALPTQPVEGGYNSTYTYPTGGDFSGYPAQSGWQQPSTTNPVYNPHPHQQQQQQQQPSAPAPPPPQQIQLDVAQPEDYNHIDSASSSSSSKNCSHCRTTTTPLWRRHPMTHKTLCNACGLYFIQWGAMRPVDLYDTSGAGTGPAASAGVDTRQECTNCETRTASTWRRNKAGDTVCNACGVYERTNGRPRPVELRSDRVKHRTRH
ncbi:unnamed protein product [Mycena citricolor]|uniref:GATA-type domain-containing protein n=1 Tax=Mycena citricolor TaxID=2018698 RepID=A0AAD2I0H3_9AGAR|nr:unnamed protein product [Mycena citricolor]